jgi:predicted SprT family Zn-dependent metalloprotease
MNLADARKLAEELMRTHKLPREWSFRFDRSKVRYGKCDYARRVISLSAALVALNTEESVRDTILHEIAHALAPQNAGHGPQWRALARAIGCKGSRCYGDEVRRPSPRFRGECRSCGRQIYRHRRTMIACGKCTPVFDAKFAFVWSEAGPEIG